ncbi:glycoside hydrolase family 16 protein [Coniophora puteana RWD-64-598 SS2]|uniref:Glycoside hydrolase family 16 protein n=1 Tax=Coniophora puteana (strain RWD-64-598) TaxID=741705 RepID=A0A5M3MED4_CONPW|nr:glycoside hydrolase family 16 protein [Coniophora puteana RWD-64-598 SS2]EIW77513.1 glycoside hydrolase family 16 protein [Coniophora puteana RWD-64-598 SS2]
MAGSALANTYTRSDNVVGDGFFDFFSWENIADPTTGRVVYLDQATAKTDNLSYTKGNSFVIAADSTTTLSASGPGRNSIRIKSNKTYKTHVVIFDVAHMPEGCGTWPALWETNESTWPNGGEIDIVEGVNNKGPNQSTIHAGPNCAIPASGGPQILGTIATTDCNSNDNGNAGCGITYNYDPNSIFSGFNSVGGGFYAMERTDTQINVWFWERSASGIPAGVSSPGDSIDTSNWGTPAAAFPSTSCDFSSFTDHNIIANIDFCGAWAGSADVYSASGCPSTCVDYVNNNPSAFTNAFFEFNAINVYQ